MGSLVKLGPGCRQNSEHRTQNSEPPPWTPEYSSPPLPSSSCASSTPVPGLRCRADCCGSGLPASLDHAAISTQTVPRPPPLQQLQLQQLQLQQLQQIQILQQQLQ